MYIRIKVICSILLCLGVVINEYSVLSTQLNWKTKLITYYNCQVFGKSSRITPDFLSPKQEMVPFENFHQAYAPLLNPPSSQQLLTMLCMPICSFPLQTFKYAPVELCDLPNYWVLFPPPPSNSVAWNRTSFDMKDTYY